MPLRSPPSNALDGFAIGQLIKDVDPDDHHKTSCLVHTLLTVIVMSEHFAPYSDEYTNRCKKGHPHMRSERPH